MTSRPSTGLGDRLARYRKMAGLSAQELSDRVGGELSRAVIANIESGRKSDITVDQLLALAWVLDIPPVALALPVHQPFQHVQVVRGETELESTTAATLIDWFLERPGLNDRPRPAGPGRTLVLAILRALARYQNQWRRTYLDSRHSDEQKASNPARYEENERELARDRQELLDLGVEMPERGPFS
ncbi:helix-turn-helix domain-containing protein [Curtobacterium flaccumfaciens pv. betae]|uniref:helix-turn-helix domain-containing protein n=1 Tax=Curtobacterium flaccumfaciens TaxID=2035 RepID=UPI00265B544C|nr:helix-turn-helix transcriptional regulator [Curtobacterium flaccumfaciens]MCS5511338.1 helix-turn-helix domain-containing protein [Curtobacterium flaccumfaciens pv. betae]